MAGVMDTRRMEEEAGSLRPMSRRFRSHLSAVVLLFVWNTNNAMYRFFFSFLL